MGLVPMYLRPAHAAIWKTDQSESLPLSPPPWAEHLPKPLDLPNSTPDGDRLNIGNPADNLELHDGLLSNMTAGVFVNLTFVFSCELTWRGPCASTGRDKADRQLQNFVIRSFPTDTFPLEEHSDAGGLDPPLLAGLLDVKGGCPT